MLYDGSDQIFENYFHVNFLTNKFYTIKKILLGVGFEPTNPIRKSELKSDALTTRPSQLFNLKRRKFVNIWLKLEIDSQPCMCYVYVSKVV